MCQGQNIRDQGSQRREKAALVEVLPEGDLTYKYGLYVCVSQCTKVEAHNIFPSCPLQSSSQSLNI